MTVNSRGGTPSRPFTFQDLIAVLNQNSQQGMAPSVTAQSSSTLDITILGYESVSITDMASITTQSVQGWDVAMWSFCQYG